MTLLGFDLRVELFVKPLGFGFLNLHLILMSADDPGTKSEHRLRSTSVSAPTKLLEIIQEPIWVGTNIVYSHRVEVEVEADAGLAFQTLVYPIFLSYRGTSRHEAAFSGLRMV